MKQGGHAEQPAGRDLGDADDLAAVIVELEFRADFGVLELAELGVLDDEEAVLGKDVLDLALDEARPAVQAAVVQAHDVDGLVHTVLQF